MAEQTRREALAAAWDKMEDTEDGDDVTVLSKPDVGGDHSEEEPPDSGDASVSEEPVAEEVTGDGESAKAPLGAKKEEKSAKSAKDDSQAKEVEAARGQPEVKDKAPNSWKPLARNDWAKIPETARAEINRRELEIQQTLSQTATVRKFANDFASVINPFSHIIRAQNSTPLMAVKNLMQTAAGLYQGSQHQKAAIIAEILTNYGVDVQVLDDYLSKNWNPGNRPGQSPPQQLEQSQMPPWAQKIHSFIDAQEQRQNAEKERMREAADAEIAKLESQPYFNDVKDDIADILEIAASKGRTMTLEEAFKKAKLLNEDVQKAIKAQRLQNLQGQNKQNQQHITRARRAASTLSGAPQGKVSGKEGGAKTRRQMLSEAWDASSE